MDIKESARIIEALLFVSDAPVPMENLQEIFTGKEPAEIRTALEELSQQMDGRALELVEIAEGFQLRTRPDVAEWIKQFHKIERSTRLSHAALEVLSIVAYKQPLTRQDIEDIRGVDCSGIVKKLIDKGLVKGMGRKRLPGKPMSFGTTKKFLEYFGLVKLSDLPMLKDFPEELEDDITQAELDLSEEAGKTEEDINIEQSAAMTEPADEDYEDDDFDDDTEDIDDDDFDDNKDDDTKNNDIEDDDFDNQTKE